MYKAKYKKRIKTDSNSKRTVSSSLYAKFSFWNETAPKERRVIRERIRDISNEFGRVCEEYCPHYNLRMDTMYAGLLKKIFLSFGIDLSVKEDVSLEEMVYLDKINHYILTGKKEK